MSERTTDQILRSSVGTLATISVAGIAVRGLQDLSKPVKNNKYI